MRITFLALLLAACGGESSDTADTGAPAILPTEGTWTTTAITFSDNGCNLPEEVASTLTLASDGAGAYDVTLDSGQATSCTPQGATMLCEPIVETVLESPTGNGTVTMTVTLTPVLSDPSTMTVGATFQGACTGSDCAQLPPVGGVTLPCTSVGSLTATAETPPS